MDNGNDLVEADKAKLQSLEEVEEANRRKLILAAGSSNKIGRGTNEA